VHRFHPPLLLSLVFLLSHPATALETSSAEEWFGKPLPRSESLITYRSVTNLAPLPLTRLSVAEAAGLSGDAAWSAGSQARTWLLESPLLVGRATLQLDLPAGAPARTILLQLKKGNAPFHTVVTATAAGAGPLTFTFPGEESDAVRLVITAAAGEPAPAATLQLEQIALGTATRIMLLGDSITAGKFADDTLGYRKVLYDQLVAAGLAIDFVGAYGAAPYEGHFQGGRKTFDFYPDNGIRAPKMDVTEDLNNYRPNVVGIFLGTNNLNDLAGAPVGPYGTTTFNTTPAGQMASLIRYLLKWRDGTRGTDLQHIFVCLISPIKSADSLVAVYNMEIAHVVRNYASGAITGQPEPVHLIDCFTPFYENPLFNNDKNTNYTPYLATALAPTNTLHPNSDGHRLIGTTCASVMIPVLSGTPLWFTDRSWESNTAGFDAEYSSQGLAVADADGDGRLDLYVTRTTAESVFRRDFLMQRGTAASYNEQAESRGIKDAGDSRGVLFADIESDGDLDLINANSPGRIRLYENTGAGFFQEITTASGLEAASATTTALLAFDAEGDGDLDLYAVNSRSQNAFYLNRGDGRFQRVDHGANDVDEPAIPSEAAAAADFDNDGDVDIYIVKRGAANKLFINNGAGYFTEGAAGAGLALNANCRGALWADLDNDADLDLLVAVSASTADPNPILRIYRNNGAGSFQDISATLNIPMSGFSVLAGDFDLDGDLDLITTGESTTGAFYRNEGGMRFTPVRSTGAETAAGDVRSGAAFDGDDDGDLDFFLTRSDIFNVYRENTLARTGHYLKIDAAGPGGNASAFGTKLWCYEAGKAGDPAALLGYREIVSGGGHLAQYPALQHFGLGNRTSCDLLAQFTDNTFLVLREVAADQILHISPQAPAAGTAAKQLAIASGQDQSGVVSERLALPLAVRALDATGKPVAGVHVDFTVLSGDASLLLPAAGSTSGLWLEAESGGLGGRLAWAYDATASGSGLVLMPPQSRSGGRDTLTFSLPAGASASLWVRARTGAAGITLGVTVDGTALTQSLSTSGVWQWIRIGAAGGWNLAAGSHRLLLEVPQGTLQLDRLLVTANLAYVPGGTGESGSGDPFATDSQGLAQRSLQLGTAAGAITVQARATATGDLITAGFRAKALAAAAATMTISGGNNQTAVQAGVPLAEPLAVTLRDAFGNPVPGAPVWFSVRSGGGLLSPADGKTITDSLGQARMVLIPGGAAGIQTVAATTPAIAGCEALFTATLVNGATNLVYLQGDAQTDTVHAVLALPVRFKVTRADGQPIASWPVLCSALSGGRIAKTAAVGADSTLQLATGSDGILSLYWRLGSQSGEQSLRIEAAGLQGSPRLLKATAVPAPPNRLLAIAGDDQTGTVAVRLATPLTVRVADRYGNPVAGHNVQFRILAGGGSLNGAGQTLYNATTDAAGTAAVPLTLGTIAGTRNNQIEAASSANGRALNGAPLVFYASATAGPPAFLFALSGNHQSGVAGTVLPDSLVVALKDFYQNTIINHPVRFSVTSGNGRVNGVSQVLTQTDAHGHARVQFQLGSQAGNDLHQVTARAEGLTTESTLFSASAVADAAARISYFSGSGQSGLVNSPLPEPLMVRVTDRFSNPAPNHPVRFTVTAGNGQFAGANTLSTTSDENGLAAAWLTLGGSLGDSTHRAEASSSLKNGTTPLEGSPVCFYARGVAPQAGDIQSIELLAGAGQSGPVQQWLSGPLRARALDGLGNPLAGKTIRFRIARGNGVLGSAQDTLTVLTTDRSGVAETTWRLGTLAGDSTQAVQMIGLDKNGLPVNGSHRLIFATALPGAPDISRSILNADSPLPADGVSEGMITATIRDAWGNPIPSQGIVLVSSGLAAEIKPVQGYSNSAGVLQARVCSKEAGTLTVQARVATSSQWLTAAKSIFFVHPKAAQLEPVGGNAQSAQVTTIFGAPLAVRVLDANGRGVAHTAVRFSLVEGNADLLDPSASLKAQAGDASPSGAAQITLYTDTTGTSAIQVRAGTRSGRIAIAAALADTPERFVRFLITALPGSAAELAVLNGNNQSGVAWHRLSQPLIVQLRDAWANGVPGQTIFFSTAATGGAFIPGALQVTDSSGVASVLWRLGGQIGPQIAQAASTGLGVAPSIFSATALANQPPQLTLPDSIVIHENEVWRYAVTARDLEGDSIRIALLIAPPGAALGPDGTISWQPTYDQAGEYTLSFEVADPFGASSRSELPLIVRNVNRPPLVDAAKCQPQQAVVQLNKPEAVDFSVAVSDPDGDPLTYTWYLNGAFCSYGKSAWRLQSELIPSGDAQVKVVISDQTSTVSRSWSLKLVSAVWLASFRAEAEPGHGIRLVWQTLLETDPLGFMIQRAPLETGPWSAISTLIPPAADGRYAFLDTSAPAGERCFYRLQALSRDGGTQTPPVVQALLPLPAEMMLSPNYPNPFNNETRMILSLPQRGPLQVEVTDLLGRCVRRLYQGEAREGYLDLHWDGRDDLGKTAASGIYYCRVVAGKQTLSRKLVLVR